MKSPFTSLACLIVRRFGPGVSSGTASHSSRVRIPGSNEKLSRELMELGGGKKNCIESYYVNKIAKFLEIAALCLAVLVVVLIVQYRQDRRIAGGVLERPGYGEGAMEQSLILTIGRDRAAPDREAESESFDVNLNARTYTSAPAGREPDA